MEHRDSGRRYVESPAEFHRPKNLVQKRSQKYMVIKLKFLRERYVVDFVGGKIYLSTFFPRKKSLKICHQNFTTFFTLKFTITKELCHLVLPLGAISRKEPLNGPFRNFWSSDRFAPRLKASWGPFVMAGWPRNRTRTQRDPVRVRMVYRCS